MGFFYPELAGLDVNLGLELTSTLIDIRWWDQRSKSRKLSSLDFNFCNYAFDWFSIEPAISISEEIRRNISFNAVCQLIKNTII